MGPGFQTAPTDFPVVTWFRPKMSLLGSNACLVGDGWFLPRPPEASLNALTISASLDDDDDDDNNKKHDT
jgi:hypothetical protein